MSDDSLFARSSALNLFGQALPLLVALVTVPVAARVLPAEAFAVIVIAWTFTGYFGVFDFGFGRAIAKLGAESAQDAARLRMLVRSAIQLQLLAGSAVALAIVALAPSLAQWLHIPAELQGAATMRLLALAVPAIMISSTYRGGLEALHRFDLVNMLRIPVNSASYAITLIGVVAGFSAYGIVALMVAARLAGALAHALAYQRAAPPGPAPLPAEWRALVRFGGWVSVTNALAPLINYLDRFLVGAIVSLAAVSYYAAPYELTSKLMIIPGSIAAVLLPSLSAAVSARNSARSQLLVQRAFRWSFLLLVVPSALLIAFAPQVLHYWLGLEYANQSTAVLRLLALAGLLNGLALIPFTAIEGFDRPDLVAKYHLIELPLYVLVAIGMIRLYGIEGAGLAWLARTAGGLLTLTLLASAVARRAGMRLRWAVTSTGAPAKAAT